MTRVSPSGVSAARRLTDGKDVKLEKTMRFYGASWPWPQWSEGLCSNAGERVRTFLGSNVALSRVPQLPLEVDHNAALDVAVMHAREDVVDVLQGFRGNRCLDLAPAGEVQGFLQIESRSDDRAANGDAGDHRVADRQRKVAPRHAVHRHRAAT